MDRAVWTMTPPCRACAGAGSMTACTQDLAACLYVPGAAKHGPGAVRLTVLTLGSSLLLQGFELDMVRMPLGQLSAAQVERGYEVLGRVQKALAGMSSDSLVTLSNEFYSVIPHNFRRSRPVRLCVLHLGQAAQSHRGLGPHPPVCVPSISSYCLGKVGPSLQQSALLRHPQIRATLLGHPAPLGASVGHGGEQCCLPPQLSLSEAGAHFTMLLHGTAPA